eukprot:6284793-Alexandrium_andersonii.AAC.1
MWSLAVRLALTGAALTRTSTTPAWVRPRWPRGSGPRRSTWRLPRRSTSRSFGGVHASCASTRADGELV